MRTTTVEWLLERTSGAWVIGVGVVRIFCSNFSVPVFSHCNNNFSCMLIRLLSVGLSLTRARSGHFSMVVFGQSQKNLKFIEKIFNVLSLGSRVCCFFRFLFCVSVLLHRISMPTWKELGAASCVRDAVINSLSVKRPSPSRFGVEQSASCANWQGAKDRWWMEWNRLRQLIPSNYRACRQFSRTADEFPNGNRIIYLWLARQNQFFSP